VARLGKSGPEAAQGVPEQILKGSGKENGRVQRSGQIREIWP